MSDNYSLSVGCIVRKNNEILLVRHTYGSAAGKLLIPGGFCDIGEPCHKSYGINDVQTTLCQG